MGEPERPVGNFLRRWSERKRAAQDRPAQDRFAEDSKAASEETLKECKSDAERKDDAGPAVASENEPAKAVFDPASLPPLESITAASDVRAFLAPGVPEELTRAALRRAWHTDPAIRDFVGLAENQWDFTAPDGAPGFGALRFTPELRRMVADLIGSRPPPSGTAEARAAEEFGSDSGGLSPALGSESIERPREPAEPNSDAAPELEARARSQVQDSAGSPSPVVAMRETAENTSGDRLLPRRHGGAVPR